MNNVEFFQALNTGISMYAEEVCTTPGKVEENLFDVKNVPPEIKARFYEELVTRFQIPIEVNRWLQFSYQEADNITYSESKLMVVYSGGEQIAKEMKAPLTKAHTGYCVNYFLESGETSYKFYDLDIQRHQMPSLPKGSILASPFGHGVSLGETRKDAYFIHSNIYEVAEFYGFEPPVTQELSMIDRDHTIPKVFGLAYNSENLKPMKLKRYFYPRDPLLKTTVFDEEKCK